MQNNNDGHTPYAALQTIIIFLIPILVFVGIALAVKKFLPPVPVGNKDLKGLISLLLAAASAVGALHLTRFIINRRVPQNKD